MIAIKQNQVTELTFQTKQSYANPFRDVALSAIVSHSDGNVQTIPGFWAGNGTWKIRYSSPVTGTYHYTTVCSDETNPDLHECSGTIQIDPYEGNNPLYRHGAITRSQNGQYLEHQDGTPFLWLGDTWWMGLTKRLSYPDDFQMLVKDRQEKGFNVIQIVAGLYPDMDPFDERGANVTGFPWDPSFDQINPAYFDEADHKLIGLVEAGLVPCIVGCWGFFIDFAGKEVIRKHWEYLIARYGAYPVAWCSAGEALMPFYTNPAFYEQDKRHQYVEDVRHDWTELTRLIRDNDPYRRLVTIHPVDAGRNMVDDPSVIDLEMLQTGHSSYLSLANTVQAIKRAVAQEPAMPVINSEVCYEGICGTNYQDIQRFVFWSCMLSGACGHTYGANGLWQLNSRKIPYGVSPHGASWGDTSWEDAYQLPGSKQVGLGKQLLAKHRWWAFEPQPEWVKGHATEGNELASYAAGIPGEVRFIFLSVLGGGAWGEAVVRKLEKDVTYRAYYYDTITGNTFDQGIVTPDADGNWMSGRVHILQDWVLVLEKV